MKRSRHIARAGDGGAQKHSAAQKHPAAQRRGRFPVPAELAAVLAFCLAMLIKFKMDTGIVLEDALITFRYAENLALGHGPVFNLGERVLGTTSPLFMLVLGVIGWCAGPGVIPHAAVVVTLVATLASLALLHATLRAVGLGRGLAILGVAFLGLHPDTLWCATGGLETSLVVLFMMAGLHAAVTERWARAGLATGLLLLTRPDTAVWALVLLAWAAVRLRAGVWKPLLAALAVTLPWAIFAGSYYGSIIPHSVVAKLEFAGTGHLDYRNWFADALWLSVPHRLMIKTFALWVVFLGAGAISILATPVRRRLAPLVVAPPLFAATLWAVRAPHFAWYLVPMTWCVGAVGVIGSGVAIEAVTRRVRVGRRWLAAALLTGSWALFSIALLRADVRTAYLQRLTQENEIGLRARMGDWLRTHTDPDATIGMEAIGYQGTTSHRRIIDFAGLVSPKVVAIHARTGSNSEMFATILRELKPDAIVLRSFEVDENRHPYGGPLFETAAARDSFTAHYREAVRFSAPHRAYWDENSLLTAYARIAGS